MGGAFVLVDMPAHSAHQSKVYYLSRERRFAPTALMELLVEPERLVLTPTARTGVIFGGHTAAVTLPLDQVIRCALVDERRAALRLVVFTQAEPKTYELTAKSLEEAREITVKISAILKGRMGEERARVLRLYEAHERLAHSKR